MAYELDFIGVEKESKKDATSICMRWQNGDGSYTVGVFDGGTADYGEAAKELMTQYYFDCDEPMHIDFVICSHPHRDHASGLSVILENFDVDALYMNRPWAHLDELLPFAKARDKSTTRDRLERRLRKNYPWIDKLEELAFRRGIPIYDVFQGSRIANRLFVLSPARDLYIQLLTEQKENMLEEDLLDESIFSGSLVEKALEFAQNVAHFIFESWSVEKLREGETTDPDNETSTVIMGLMDEETFLLTGDVGLRGLRCALDYTRRRGVSIRDSVEIYEIPHHGGRHNVSPSILNELLGGIVPEGVQRDKTAFVCTGNGSDHPKKMVVNAFLRRGVKVLNASNSVINYHVGLPARSGWSSAPGLEFSQFVEEWK